MASSDKELEQQLVEAGNKLKEPPPSVDELLPLLDQVENCLAKVEQSPSKAMQDALSPSLKALVADKLFRHSNADVKVAVASCISEITRITAPDAPYDDEQMKEVFQLIVSSFENLVDKSSRSYAKRTSILETVAKVRSCVVMLDLECDVLIIEMFQHFLKAIRDYHPENVFSSMETIMTLVLEESEDISLELLSPMLDSVKKDNEEVLPVARKLAERVFINCSTKVKPYLVQAIKSLGISLEDYSDVVANICQETTGDMEQNDGTTDDHAADESKSARMNVDEAAEADKETAKDVEVPSEQVGPTNDGSPRSIVSNGITQARDDDSLADSNSTKKELGHHTDTSKDADLSSNAGPGNVGTVKVVDTEPKLEASTEIKGKKTISVKVAEPSGASPVDGEKETEKVQEDKDTDKDRSGPPHKDLSISGAGSSENEKPADIKPSSPKAIEGESVNVAPLSPSESLPDESRLKRSMRVKKKETSLKEDTPSVDVCKKASDGTSDSETKPSKRPEKKVASVTSNEDKTQTLIDSSNKESGSTSDSDARPIKQSAKKVEAASNNAEEPLKQTEDKRKRNRGKAASVKGSSKTPNKDEDKEMVSSPKLANKSSKDVLEATPKTNPKRKRTPAKEKASDVKEYGENLVGSKVKVWWPDDQMFYEGVIDSYDSVKKKHKVLYTDGDEEILNLKKEKWEIIKSDSESDEEEAADHTNTDASSEMPEKKKAKTNSDRTKQGKTDASQKRGSSSKSKAAATKSSRKSKDEDKSESKSKSGSKANSKAENDNVGKSKDSTGKVGGKLVDAASKLANKSKNEESATPKSGKSKEDSFSMLKTSAKKQETPTTSKFKNETMKTSSAKGKLPKSGGKSNVNGTGKSKSGSSKVKESDEMEEDSAELAKSPESTKGKTTKTHGSEAKSGKKRRR